MSRKPSKPLMSAKGGKRTLPKKSVALVAQDHPASARGVGGVVAGAEEADGAAESKIFDTPCL